MTSLSNMECCGSTQLSLSDDEGCANAPGCGDAPGRAKGKATSSCRAPNVGCDGSTSLSNMECCGSTQLSLSDDEGCANAPGRAKGKAASSCRALNWCASEFVRVGLFMILSTLDQPPSTLTAAPPRPHHRGLVELGRCPVGRCSCFPTPRVCHPAATPLCANTLPPRLSNSRWYQ